MARRSKGRGEHGAIELIEQAVHLVRTAGGTTLATYLIGTLPFVLGLLFFWMDTSRSAFADRRLAEASLAVAVLFVWMKCWQTVYAARLHAQLAGGEPPRWTPARVARMGLAQAALQPWGIVAVAALAALSFRNAALGTIFALLALLAGGTAHAFFQNTTLLADGEMPAAKAAGRAWRLARLWPGQIIGVSFVMGLFSLFVLINVLHAMFLPAMLLKMLFGVETVFSRGGFNEVAGVFVATCLGLSYAMVDPILKAVATLRCFYGRSLQTGEDLKAELRRLRTNSAGLAALFLLGAGVLLASPAPAQAAPDAPDAPRVARAEGEAPAEQLDDSIRRVISRRKYAWRMPREREQEQEQQAGEPRETWLSRWLNSVLERIGEWLRKLFSRRSSPREPADARPAAGMAAAAKLVMYLLLAAAVVFLIVMGVWALRKRRDEDEEQAASASAATPDLEDEDLSAEDLPEEGWLDLARRMFAEGDRRLALRAMYLAALAALADRGLISIARCKSNWEYSRELQRRGHALPELASAFSRNVGYFEDTWYGMHDVTDGIVSAFIENQKRIRQLDET